jgi:hypothetical protein
LLSEDKNLAQRRTETKGIFHAVDLYITKSMYYNVPKEFPGGGVYLAEGFMLQECLISKGGIILQADIAITRRLLICCGMGLNKIVF